MEIDTGVERRAIKAYSEQHLFQFIRTNFVLGPAPTVPEIHLYTAGPKSGLWRLAERDDAFGSPYWAHYWGGGLAVARHILDNPATVAGRRVLDLGAGSGIAGIAAAKAGAARVLSVDIDPYAAIASQLNAAANGVTILTVVEDITTRPVPDVDIIIVGDLFYERGLAAKVMAFLERSRASGIDVLIGDPRRAFLPISRLELIAEYPGPDFPQSRAGAGGKNAVFALAAPADPGAER